MVANISAFSKVEKCLLAIIIVILGILSFYNWIVALLASIVAIAVMLFMGKHIKKRHRALVRYVETMADNVAKTNNYALQNLPMAIAVIDSKFHICWSNSVFKDWVGGDVDKTQRLSAITSAMRIEKAWGKSGYFEDVIDDKTYMVYHKFLPAENTGDDKTNQDGFMALYYSDITETERVRKEAEESHPVFVYIEMDNIEDVTKGVSDIEHTNVWAEVNNIIVEEFDRLDGFIRAYSNDSYVGCISKEALKHLEEQNFQILDRVRGIHTPKQVPMTISMGIALEIDSMKELSEKARAALDLSLGRGGDQVAVYTGDQVKFYGGKTQGAEKNTKVRARVVSQTIRGLIKDAGNVIIMGHNTEDYDSIGGAIGVSAMAKADNIPVHVVVSDHSSAIQKLQDLLPGDSDMSGLIISPAEAEALTNERTLLFIVDVHRPDMVAAPRLLEKTENRVVIDHHRRTSDFIAKPLLTYLETTSSSTSELVTELVEYYTEPVELTELEASALYAGIVVDTKNFIIQTGARTFDAAAYLRRAGANLGTVRQLFQQNFDVAKQRAEILSNTKRYGECAVAICPKDTENASVVCAQIADTLNSIEGIEMSFVFYYRETGGIGVSARSQGKYNVQLVMESLGGGGHRTVAGAQLDSEDMEACEKMVIEAAEEHIKVFNSSEEEAK